MHMGAVSGLPALPSYPLYSQVSEEESGKPDTVLKSHWPPEHQLMVLSLITVSKVKIWTHLLGRHCNKGLDDFIFSHMKFQVNYTCTVLCYFGNTGTNLMILIFFVVFFFLQVRCHKHSNNPSFKKYVYNIKRIKMKYKPFYLQFLYRLTKSKIPQINVKL